MADFGISLEDDSSRPSLDTYLLCAFSDIRPDEAVVDLGTASGIIPLILAKHVSGGVISGVEVQPQLAEVAKRNLRLNRLHERITIICADHRDLRIKKIMPMESADVVITNPPYRKPGTGKIAPDAVRASCRHELHGTIEDFIATAFYLLRSKGRFYLVFLPERLPELLMLMGQHKIEPKRLRCVHSRPGAPAVLVLIEGRKNGRPGMRIDAPLYVYDGDDYSPEMKAIYRIG